MGHSHDHSHPTKNIKTAFFLNVFFALIEFIGGILTNSIAIMSDALHDLGDSFSLGLAWYFQKLSNKKRDEVYTYGYKRFSILGGIINSIILFIGSGIIIYNAIPRLFDPIMPDARGMIALSILGIIINGIAAARLLKSHTLNERAVYLHLLEDVLGWVATLGVSITLLFYELPILDPILSLLISVFILYNAGKILKKSTDIILQKTPENIDAKLIEDSIRSEDLVKDVHDCHIWSMDGSRHILSIHIVLEKDVEISAISSLKKNLKEKIQLLGIDHSTFEFELENEDCHSC
jgi:cobalt-zinc-cadmium efflux system protein